MKAAVEQTLTDQLLTAIHKRGLTERELAEATGVDHISIIYFIRGKDLGLRRASKIASFLGLAFCPPESSNP